MNSDDKAGLWFLGLYFAFILLLVLVACIAEVITE